MTDAFDLLVIGGGVNGAGIARDAAGRGLKVLLCEKADLAQGTSSRSGKLVHGGLRYLEYFEFRLVREALLEREILLGIAPHIIWPMRFVLPHSREQRPAWMIRLGLLLYDHLGGRRKLPGARRLDLRTAPEGAAIKPEFRTAFAYSDCWVDDARLVVLNALDARNRGAEIRLHTEVVSARREEGVWRVQLASADGSKGEVYARALVNAAGPWVERVIREVMGANSSRRVRLVKGSHVIVRKFWDGTQAYLLQNDDRRVLFVNPYDGDFCLIGTTDVPYEGDADDVRISEAERQYLLRVVNRYARHQLTTRDILHEYSGVRPLYDDHAANPSAVTRDYVFDIGTDRGKTPELSIFGGKITTYRKLAEHALDRLAPFFPQLKEAWTARAPLPGGDMPGADFAAYLAVVRRDHPWLPAALAAHYVRHYGTRVGELLDGARSLEALGRHFGALLYEREADFLRRTEWARSAEDVLERRTKHYLRLGPDEVAAFAAWMGRAQ